MFIAKIKQAYSKGNTPNEHGMTIVEVMAAVVIIAGVLIFTASGLITSSRAAVANENRTKATAYANEVLAIAQQAEYRNLFIPTTSPNENWANGQCEPAVDNRNLRNQAAAIVRTGQNPQPFTGLEECQVRQSSNQDGAVGPKFYVQTYVYGFQVDTTPNGAMGKEVFVKVRWNDVAGGGEMIFSTKRVPKITECYVSAVGQSQTLRQLNSTIPGCNVPTP